MEQPDSGSWRQVEGHPQYSVSASGQVWSSKSGRLLRVERMWNGYNRVVLDGKKWPVHQLVALHFHAPKPSPAHLPNHKNGIKHDNRAENLEWLTPAENRTHARSLGLLAKPDGNPMKLTFEKAREIRAQKPYKSNQQLAKEYGVTPVLIGLVVNGRIWKETPLTKVPLS